MPVVSADAVPARLRHGADEQVHSPDRAHVRLAPARPTATLAAAGDLLRALAAPVRIAIVLELRAADRCVHELVAALGVTQPLISQHLRVLKAAGVVSGERHGREVVYRLVDEHLAHIVVDAVTHAEEAVEGVDAVNRAETVGVTDAVSRADGAVGVVDAVARAERSHRPPDRDRVADGAGLEARS
jgi:ArsR family transcriptional regulator, zinc-responsive transcriptional repressor